MRHSFGGRSLVLLAVAAVAAAVLATSSATFGRRGGSTAIPPAQQVQFVSLPRAQGRLRPQACLRSLHCQSARLVHSYKTSNETVRIWVAPLRIGGFCEMINTGGGCAVNLARLRKLSLPAPRPGEKDSFVIAPSYAFARPAQAPSLVYGHVLSAEAAGVRLEYADGTYTVLRLLHVSAPIDASFFLGTVPRGHRTGPDRLLAVSALSRDGRVVARQLAPTGPPMPSRALLVRLARNDSVAGNRGASAAITAARIRSDPLHRPLHLPHLGPGKRCPVSPARATPSAGNQTLIGRGPAYLIAVRGGGATINIGMSARDKLGWYGQKTPWLINRSYDGPILVRGGRIDRRGELRFAYGYGQHLRELYWRSGADQGLPPDPNFRFLPSEMLFRAPGCYVNQIDGTSFSRIIVFRVRR